MGNAKESLKLNVLGLCMDERVENESTRQFGDVVDSNS